MDSPDAQQEQDPNQPEYDFLFKAQLVGDSGVGKSSLIRQFTTDVILPEQYVSTRGVEFRNASFRIGNKIIKFQFWDSPVSESFRTFCASYYRGADGIIIVYDVTRRTTFYSVRKWIREIDRYASKRVAKLLLGCKNDLKDQREVSTTDGKRLAIELNIPFVETSFRDTESTDSAFMLLAAQGRRTRKVPLDTPHIVSSRKTCAVS